MGDGMDCDGKSEFTAEQRRLIAENNLICGDLDDLTIRHALFVWSGDDPETARAKAVGGADLPCAGDAVLTMCKLTPAKKKKIGNASDIARLAAPKAAQVLYNAVRIGPRLILRSTFELLRANVITRVLSAVVLLAIDSVSLAKRRISKKQFVINVILALMLLVGGTAGWYLGNNIVSWMLIENIVIGIVAGIIGAGVLGAVLGIVWEKIVGLFVKDDMCDMIGICNEVFAALTKDYLFNESEARRAVESIVINARVAQDMYAQKDKAAFAADIIRPRLDEIINTRERINAPDIYSNN